MENILRDILFWVTGLTVTDEQINNGLKRWGIKTPNLAVNALIKALWALVSPSLRKIVERFQHRIQLLSLKGTKVILEQTGEVISNENS